MANTFLAARGVDVGKSLCEHDFARQPCWRFLDAADRAGCTIHLPYDVVVAQGVPGQPTDPDRQTSTKLQLTR